MALRIHTGVRSAGQTLGLPILIWPQAPLLGVIDEVVYVNSYSY